jgi:hypothetical protein
VNAKAALVTLFACIVISEEFPALIQEYHENLNNDSWSTGWEPFWSYW